MARKKVSTKGRWIQFGVAMFSAVAGVLQLHGRNHILIGFALCAVGGGFGAIMLVRRNRREGRESAAQASNTEGSASASNAG